jgi:hypothetical protein
MTVDWFSFFFGAMALLCVEFVALVIFGVAAYSKQQKLKKN